MEGNYILDAHEPEHVAPEYQAYSGFWPRLGALLLDGLIISPVSILVAYLNFLDLNSYYYSALVSFSVALVYNVYFISKKGATPGKQIAGLKVISTDGTPVTLQAAVLRYSPTIVLGVLSFLVTLVVIQSADADNYQDLSWMPKMRYLASLNPTLMNIPTWLSNLWTFTSFVVLLANRQNRTLHDFIADTVVVKTGR